jgi:hypothetical protein
LLALVAKVPAGVVMGAEPGIVTVCAAKLLLLARAANTATALAPETLAVVAFILLP